MPRSSPRRSPKPCPSGTIRNPQSGRCIKEDGKTFKKLQVQKHDPHEIIPLGRMSLTSGLSGDVAPDKTYVELYRDAKNAVFAVLGRKDAAFNRIEAGYKNRMHHFMNGMSGRIIRSGSAFIERRHREDYDQRTLNRVFNGKKGSIPVYLAF